MTNIGYATVSVIPTAKNFGRQLSAQVNPQLTAAGVTSGTSFGNGLVQGAKRLVGPLVGLFAGAAAVGFFKDAAVAAADEEKAVRSLAVTLSNMGQGSALQGVEATIASLSKMSAVADDEIRPAFQRIFTASGSVATATSAMSLALDIAAGTGRSVEETAAGLAKAYSGQTTALSRMGVGLDKALLASGDMNAITGALSEKFKGQASSAAKTYSGQLASVSVAAGEASEQVGTALLDAVGKVSKAFGGSGGAGDAITWMGKGLSDLVGGIGQTVTQLTVLTRAMADFLKLKNGDGTPTPGDNSAVQSPIAPWLQSIPVAGSFLSYWANKGAEATAKTDALTASLLDGSQSYRIINESIKASIGVHGPLFYATEDSADATNTLAASAVTAKSAIDQLNDSLTATNGINRSLLSDRSALAQQWADLATMGATKTVGKKATSYKDIHGKTIQVPSTEHQVQLAFDPATRNGRFDLTDSSGRQGAAWLTGTAAAAEKLALDLFSKNKPIRAESVLADQRSSIAAQLEAWGISRPRATAASVLSTPGVIAGAADARRGANVAGDRLAGVVNNYNINGDIKVNSAAEITRTAHELARLKALSGGQIPAAAS